MVFALGYSLASSGSGFFDLLHKSKPATSSDNLLADQLSLADSLSYAKRDELFTVITKRFKVVQKFTAAELWQRNQKCGGDRQLAYFKQLLTAFSPTDDGIEYRFVFKGDCQGGRDWSITVVPNKIGYTNFGNFQNDFDLCDINGETYPYLLSKNYLAFCSAPTSGLEASQGLPLGREVLVAFLKPTIKLR